MGTIIIFIIVLGVLVLVHELGHFWAAKAAKCKVHKFSIGFPPVIFRKKYKETDYQVGALPLGGYVSIEGEDGNGDKDDPGNFSNKSFAWKTLIISAGVLMNIALAYVLMSIGLIAGVPVLVEQDTDFGKFARLDDNQITIVNVLENTPAQEVGIEAGDVITKINGDELFSGDDLVNEINTNPESEKQITITREGEELQFSFTPIKLEQTEQYGVGVSLAETASLSYPWYVAPYYGFIRTFTILWLILTSFAGLIVGLFQGAGLPAEIAGPVGIAALTGEVAKHGIIQLMQFTALLSLNLAIINILPFPALDGGRLLFVIIAKVSGKKVNVNFEKWLHIFGFAALMLLMLLITIKDVLDFFT